MKIIKLEDQENKTVIHRSKLDANGVMDTVKDIVADTRKNGDLALAKYTENFDKVIIDHLRVNDEEIEKSFLNLDLKLITALKKAAANIEKFHTAQIPEEWSIEVEDGVTAGQIVRPIENVGCYIPGGRAVYPSTILMTVIPAKIAGVKRIICCTPPQSDGTIKDVVLAAAKVAGATEIYKVGGAQAIAAMAYGTETIPKVDKIVGPGNIFVTAAKKHVYGEVDIDFPAGPSEVLIIADDSADPGYVALDMMAQAEHDPDAASILVTPSENFANLVNNEIIDKIDGMERAEIIKESLEKYGIIAVSKNIEEAVKFSNEYAPEHLIIMTEEPEKTLKDVDNAGSIFLGDLTPVAAGDYGSGTNHVLPTSGCARMYSGLSAESFLKKPTVQKLTEKGLLNLNDMVTTLAEYEGLYAHAESFKKRVTDVEDGKK